MPTPGRCLLCGSERGEIVLRESAYVGRSCACGVVYIDPMPPADAVDPTIDHHPQVYYEESSRARLAWTRRFRTSGRVLEVGCGEGAFVARALRAGFEVDAIEPCPKRAARVEAKYGVSVECGLIEETRLPAGAYDIVCHVDLLSHFRDPVAALKAMRERLAPEGLLIFEIGLFGGLPRRWYPFTGRPNFPTHLWFFTEGSIDRLLERAGLRRIAIEVHSIGLSTIISSLLIRLFRSPHLRREADRSGDPLAAGLLGDAYYRFHGLLVRAGRWLPRFGPSKAFVAAVATDAGE